MAILNKIEGHRAGDISDLLRAWTELVAEILNTQLVESDYADDSVTFAKMQNLVALCVLGNPTAATADPAEIVAAANDVLLRRTSDTINFGGLTVGMIANSLITYAKLQNATAVSVLGRSANSAGVLADIVAGGNDRLLARVSDAISFVQLTIGMVPDALLTFAKIQDADAVSVLGRSANSAGVLNEIAAAANDVLLRRTGDTINFGALTIGMVANSLLTYAKIQNSAGVSVLGRSANSTGVLADITASANDRLLARVADALSFVQLAIGMVPDALLTFAKFQNADAVSVLGRSVNSSGVLDEIAAGANDRLLARVSNALSFVQLTIGMHADAIITYAKLQNAGACSLLGRSANSSGVLADISAGTNDRLLARVANALSFVQLTAGMVPNSLITNAMRADMAEATISLRAAGAGAGPPIDGTAAQLLEILGLNAPVHETAVSVSGTSVDFTGIPSWARKISIMFSDVSLTGTDNFLIQIGDSGGLETTGYDSGSTAAGGGAADTSTSASGFIIRNAVAAAEVHGIYTLILVDAATNLWAGAGNHYRNNTVRTMASAGKKALSGTLDRLSVIPSGANSYDGTGMVNLRYEG